MSKYKLIQLTNNSIGAITADSLLPLGIITRKINCPLGEVPTFQVGSTLSDTVYINEPGYYKVTYSATLVAGAAGEVSVALITNGNTIYTVGEEATAAEDIVDLTLPYVIRVCPNSCSAPSNVPVAVQLKLGETALGVTPNPSTANLIIEKIF